MKGGGGEKGVLWDKSKKHPHHLEVRRPLRGKLAPGVLLKGSSRLPPDPLDTPFTPDPLLLPNPLPLLV